MRKRKKSNSQLVFQCGFPLRIPRMYRTEIRGYLYDLYLADVAAALIRNGNAFQKRIAGPRRFDRRLCNLVPRDRDRDRDSFSSSSRYVFARLKGYKLIFTLAAHLYFTLAAHLVEYSAMTR